MPNQVKQNYKKMFFEHHDCKPRNPYLGIALDEALSQSLARDENMQDFQGGFRLWTSPYSIVLGRTCGLQENLQKKFIENSGLPVCRRISGGGTVLNGPGSINYSIFLLLKEYPKMFSLKYSYSVLLKMIANALQSQDIVACQAGLSDLAVAGEDKILRKISGNAQFRRRQVLVFHGTLITHKDFIKKIKKYLSHPPKEPSYRQGRKHSDFMGYLPPTFNVKNFSQRLSRQIKNIDGKNQSFSALSYKQRLSIYSLARKMIHRQYAQPEWILKGKNPGPLKKDC